MPDTMSLEGVVGREEPELKQTPSGRYLCNFVVKNTKALYKGKPQTGYWRVSCFGELAERVHKWIREGQVVKCRGKDSSRAYEAKEADEDGLHCRIGYSFSATSVVRLKQVEVEFGDGEAEAEAIAAEAVV